MHAMRALAPAVTALMFAAGALALGACARPAIEREALLDSAACAGCHPDQYREWAASSHAYSSDDPIFKALVLRGQRETHGGLGGFCANCHAPMALRDGYTVDGSDMDQVPRSEHGVTCYFCHDIKSVDGEHNGPITLADDTTMRGAYADPVDNPAHGSAHDPLVDGGNLMASSSVCGSCHDVTSGTGVAIERTYAEWKASLFAGGPPAALSCGRCHMLGRDGAAATGANMPTRRLHDHTLPGLDMPMIPWPDTDRLQAAIVRDLDPSITAKLCVQPAGGGLDVEVTLDDVSAGHAWPSGVTHARRAWVELVARQNGQVVHQSGVVPAGGDAVTLTDPDLWLLRQRFLDDKGAEVAMPWDAKGIDYTLLPPAVTNNPNDPRFYHAVTKPYAVPLADEVEMHVRITSMGLGVLQALEASGDLAPGYESTVPTFDIAPAVRVWHASDGYGCQ